MFVVIAAAAAVKRNKFTACASNSIVNESVGDRKEKNRNIFANISRFLSSKANKNINKRYIIDKMNKNKMNIE